MSGSAPPFLLVSDPSQTHQANIIVCAVLTWLTAMGFVLLRFYTRWRIVHVLGVEDWMILLAALLSGVSSSATIREAALGWGKHLGDIGFVNFEPILESAWLILMAYSLSLTFIKISILLLYIRILTYHCVKYAAYFLLSVVVCIGFWYVACISTACIPLEAYWDMEVAPTFCWPVQVWWMNLGLHMGTDLLIFLLPMPVIFNLRVRWQQKALLYCLFAFGFFVCITSIVRLVVLIEDENRPDGSYTGDDIEYWNCIELNTSIVCACIMTYQPLILKALPNLLDSRPNSFDWEEAGRACATGQPAQGGGGRPLTIGSRPVRPNPSDKDHESWVFGSEHGRPASGDETIVGSGKGAGSRDGETLQMEDLEAAIRAARGLESGHNSWLRTEDEDEDEDDGSDEFEWPHRPRKARLREPKPHPLTLVAGPLNQPARPSSGRPVVSWRRSF